MQAPQLDEHRWLQQMIGDWAVETECAMGPGQPPFRGQGIERVRAHGPYWTIIEGTGEMPGGDGDCSYVVTLGYDAAKARFVGTWVGTPVPMLWVYQGTLDAARRVLTLGCEGPSMSGDGSVVPYEDIHEVIDAGRREMRARCRDKDGTWQQFMTVRMRRRA